MNESEKKVRFLTVQEFADAIGVHPQTVRQWDRDDTLKPHHRTPGGQRMYSEEQVQNYLNSGDNTEG